METKEQKNGNLQAMEHEVLKQVSFITDSFLGKGLFNVLIEKGKSIPLKVCFSFKDGKRITRVFARVDEDKTYVVSVYNPNNKLVFLSFSKYDSDFRCSLYQQCSALADLPF